MADWESDLPFRTCLERLEWEVHRLDSRDKEWREAKQRVRVRQDKTSRVERAFSFIYVAGVLEDLFRELNFSLAVDLQKVTVYPHDLRPSALSVLVPSAWEAINTDRVVRLIRRRDLVDVANNFYASSDPLSLSGISQLGLNDGRTVNVHQFEAVWEGLCLAGPEESVWPSSKHRQAVLSVADKRNTIAHFNTDPRDEAFRFSYGDLRDLATRVTETVERLHEHAILWLDRHESDGAAS